MTVDPQRARALYGTSALAPLWAAARERLERKGRDARGRVTLRGLDADQRRAVAALLGARAEPAGDVWVRLEDVDAALRRQALEAGLPEVLEALGDPLRRRLGATAVRAEARAIVFGETAEHPAVARHPALVGWVEGLRTRGRLSRLAPEAGRELLRQALDVALRLPADGVPLPVVAGEATGDTHALDRGTPLAILVESALPAVTGAQAADRRSLWDAAGVTTEGVSSTALVLGLRVDHPRLGPLLAAAADAGEPLHVTLRMLRDVPALRADGVVSVCENRSVMEAIADRLGPRSLPLVCTSGEPSAAGRRLLAALVAGGTRLRYHGDFDPDGIAIANSIIGRGIEPWRFGAADYLEAVDRTAIRTDLPGLVPDARWDESLAAAMAASGSVIYEEQLLERLASDLDPSAAIAERAVRVVSSPAEAPDAWVSASRTRNWLLGDPVADWLRLHGADGGFYRDDELPGFDLRTDFAAFMLAQGQAFEAGVMRLLESRAEVSTIAREPGDATDPALAAATLDAMREGAPVIAQGVLHDAEAGVFGIPDLLVRADLLAEWFPLDLEESAALHPASALGVPWHYRVVDVKFHGFDLLRDGHASTEATSLPFLGQVWLYNQALGRAQGFRPPSAYLLGRGWKQGSDRVRSCLDRLARVDHDRWIAGRGASLGTLATRAVDWIRRLRADGAAWSVLPSPSVPELRPNMRRADDAPWHAARRRMADELRDLTVLPRVSPDIRSAAAIRGMTRWDDQRVSAATLGITSEVYAARLDAVLAANRSAVPVVLPERLVNADPTWRTPAPFELFVDFETVSDLDDDFARLPEAGGQPLIFQVGCGWMDPSAGWQFRQWTTDRLTVAEEGRILSAWLATMAELAAERGLMLPDVRLCHWSAAETSVLETAYNAARTRHPDEPWPDPDQLAWFDLLERVARAEPLAVTGAWGFGLKGIAKGMAAMGLIPTTWGDGPTDGLGAMVGGWWCDREARRLNIPMTDLPLMAEIGRYNETDCRVMAESLAWLREHR